MLYLSSRAEELVKNCCFLAGPGRSGSTLWGRILGTMQKTCYLYEPEFLHALFPASSWMQNKIFRFLFEAFLYEEKFINTVSGRSLNFNKNDLSSIYKIKKNNEIKTLISKKWTKTKVASFFRNYRCIVKLTDNTMYLEKISTNYQTVFSVITHRNAEDCIRSLILKKWFSNSSLSSLVRVWPSRQRHGLVIPHWVPDNKIKNWVKWPEAQRAAFYYQTLLSSVPKRKNQIVASYENLVTNPRKEISRISDFLNLKPSAVTKSLISEIKKPVHTNFNFWCQVDQCTRKICESLSCHKQYSNKICI